MLGKNELGSNTQWIKTKYCNLTYGCAYFLRLSFRRKVLRHFWQQYNSLWAFLLWRNNANLSGNSLWHLKYLDLWVLVNARDDSPKKLENVLARPQCCRLFSAGHTSLGKVTENASVIHNIGDSQLLACFWHILQYDTITWNSHQSTVRTYV